MAWNANNSVEQKCRITLMRSTIIKKASQDEQKINQQKLQTLITSKNLCPFKKAYRSSK